jgi:hypothetical protein
VAISLAVMRRRPMRDSARRSWSRGLTISIDRLHAGMEIGFSTSLVVLVS